VVKESQRDFDSSNIPVLLILDGFSSSRDLEDEVIDIKMFNSTVDVLR
jgi:hypothetical protein